MKKIIAVLGLSAVLTVSGCWIQEKGNDGEVMTESELEEFLEEVTTDDGEIIVDEEFEAEVEVFAEIIGDDDATTADCENIEDIDLKSTCEQKFLYEDAVSSGNTENCSQLENEYDQETCVTEIENS